jgi:glutamine amidotransferase
LIEATKVGGPKPRIVIVDYGTGNLNSLRKVLHRIGAEIEVSASADDIEAADKIILPGVGHFETAMSSLERLDLIDKLHESVLVSRKPVLGICLGMELMAKESEEASRGGLGWLDAHAVRISVPATGRYKVPHMGWNQISITKASRLMSGLDAGSEFYFAHSYYVELRDRSDLLSETQYGSTFPSSIERENIFGVQFHPEKSHDAGAHLLRNFVQL